MSARAAMRWGLLLVLAALVAVAVLYRDRIDTQVLQQWIEGSGALAPLLFMAVYALATVLFLPGSVLTLAGGALFGPVLGTFLNLTGATIGATLAFLAARYLGADWVERKAGGGVKRLKDGVESEGWRFVAFVRLVPLFPFNLLNYALGLTRIPLWTFVIASYVCMFPGAVAYTYLGYAGREAAAGDETAIQKGLFALALVAAVAFLPRLIGRLRQKPMLDVRILQKRLRQGEDLLVLDVRSVEEFEGESGRVPGAQNIPVEQLRARIGELNDRTNRPIAIVCRTDRRSAKAARLLMRKGFADVHVVRGGMEAWNRHMSSAPAAGRVTR